MGFQLIDKWKITEAPAYPDPVYFNSGQKARAFQANHGGEVWHRKVTPWKSCDRVTAAAEQER